MFVCFILLIQEGSKPNKKKTSLVKIMFLTIIFVLVLIISAFLKYKNVNT